MRGILLVVSASVLMFPPIAHGQEWTPAQNQVWAWEVACLETVDLEAKAACFHDDFMGLGFGETEPTGKAHRLEVFEATMDAYELVSFDVRPMTINVKGNTAVLIYEAESVIRDKATGEEASSVLLWTDVAIREGGRWSWIADHATPPEET